MPISLSRDEIIQLFLVVTSIEQQAADIVERRAAVLERLAEIVEAEGGFWGWGRGHPVASAITPVASVSFGFTSQEWTAIIAASLDDDTKALCTWPIAERLRTTPHVTMARSMLWTDEEWYGSGMYARHLHSIGWDDWMTSVRYLSDDTWSCLTLWRRQGRAPFGPREVALVDLAVAGIHWLHPRASETIPPQAFVDLTDRQRMVMIYLLDGLSRKQIANSLGVTLHTVNDHVKSLYERFQINSATELAAKFLKAR